MSTSTQDPSNRPAWRGLHRNIWATSLTSFLMDVSSEMVTNILPLFLSNVLGVKTNVIGLIEGVAEATASLLKVFSGWLSDKLRQRKWLAVAGYGISALVKPLFFWANSWWTVAAVRWADRFGKGIRTAPRDALIADSASKEKRGLAFGVQRAADTGGALFGLLIALAVVWFTQRGQWSLGASTFRTIVLISLIPGFLAVLSLAIGAKDVPVTSARPAPKFAFRSLGKRFTVFMVIVGLFDLGNSSDAFLVLRAQERGLNVLGVLAMLATFNLIYALVSAPAGSLSDRIGRRKLVIGGWLVYAVIYFGFGLARTGWQVWVLYALYGLYYGLSYGTAKAMVADIVPEAVRGTAYGTYNAVLGILDFPASLIAGLLWSGIPSLGFRGFGAPAPFLFGGAMALLAAIALWRWQPVRDKDCHWRPDPGRNIGKAKVTSVGAARRGPPWARRRRTTGHRPQPALCRLLVRPGRLPRYAAEFERGLCTTRLPWAGRPQCQQFMFGSTPAGVRQLQILAASQSSAGSSRAPARD